MFILDDVFLATRKIYAIIDSLTEQKNFLRSCEIKSVCKQATAEARSKVQILERHGLVVMDE